MNTYQVFIDVPKDEDWNEIEVESLEIEAKNTNEAYVSAISEARKLWEAFYVWEVTEEDKI